MLRAVPLPTRSARQSKKATKTAIQALLADDVVFTSPVAFKPYVGKPITAAILRGVVRIFEDFRYIREIHDSNGGNHVLEFEAGIAGAPGPDGQRLRFPARQRRRSDRRL